MPNPQPTSKSEEIIILPVSEGKVTFSVIGTMPLIFNRMSEKAKRDLLMGAAKKTAAEKAFTVKHNPIEEYRNSVYRNSGDTPATRLKFPSPAVKGVLRSTAVDLPGARKAQIGRLVWVDGVSIDIYGVPKLFMSVVRSADQNRTPDIRTRAILPTWCCTFTVSFVQPNLTAKSMAHLLAGGGIICGVGDWRQEKGSGSYGQFRICDPTDADFQKIVNEGARAAQDAALDKYEPYEEETAELLDFYSAEIIRLGRDERKPKQSKKERVA